MILLNSTKCLCGIDLAEKKFEKYTPKAFNDRFYGGRVAMEGEITCECGRKLKGYFEEAYKMNKNYSLIDLELIEDCKEIKDITSGEKTENTPTSCVENEQTEDQTMIVEENAVYVPKEYEQMKYDELRAICKEKGINSYGKKRDELIAELKGLN